LITFFVLLNKQLRFMNILVINLGKYWNIQKHKFLVNIEHIYIGVFSW